MPVLSTCIIAHLRHRSLIQSQLSNICNHLLRLVSRRAVRCLFGVSVALPGLLLLLLETHLYLTTGARANLLTSSVIVHLLLLLLLIYHRPPLLLI